MKNIQKEHTASETKSSADNYQNSIKRGSSDNFIIQLLHVIPPYTGEGEGLTISKIQKKLSNIGIQRSERTLQRKINDIREYYLDVSDSEKAWKIQLKKNLGQINFGCLTRSESFLLTLAYKQLDSMLPASLKIALQSLFTQASFVFNNNPQAILDRQWVDKIYAANPTQPLIPAENNPGVLDDVTEALYKNNYLKVIYKNKIGEVREGDVMPLALVQQGNKMLLVCCCNQWSNQNENKSIYWNLMLHRIQSTKILENHSFIRPAEFNVKEYEAKGGFGVGYGEMIRLKFDMKRHLALSLLETKLSSDQTHECNDKEWITIKATVADNFILNHWLNGFGSDVKNITKEKIDS